MPPRLAQFARLVGNGVAGSDAAVGVAVPGATLVEACVQTLSSATAAARVGADRLELCSALNEGGITPSAGLLRVVRGQIEIPVHVLIRPRGGDFRYTEGEIEASLEDVKEAKRAGADGVVVGALARDGTIDRATTGRLVAKARPLCVTFHRAVDSTPDIGAAVATLVELGVERVLTSGGGATAEQGISTLAQLVQVYGRSIAVLAGGGVRQTNARRVVSGTGVREVHLGPLLQGSWELDVDALRAVLLSLNTRR